MVVLRRQLLLGAVDDFAVPVGRLLWFLGGLVAFFNKEVLDVTIHGQPAGTVGMAIHIDPQAKSMPANLEPVQSSDI